MNSEGCLRVGQEAPEFTATAVFDQEFKYEPSRAPYYLRGRQWGFNMVLLTSDTINLLLLIMGFLALVFVLIYIAFEGGGADEDEEESDKK